MTIYLSGEVQGREERDEAEEFEPDLDELTPHQIVAELDKYVVGQKAA
ncbi:MAG: hypothetical protein HYX74_11885, partial [Acidobacteria bacterium]|nr:hypothetical protein [Acidobacteriota bacterium]